MTPRILIIAGSDSGGGAGLQADIKTVTMLGGHAMTAVTAITAQNTLGVQAVLPVPAEMVIAQVESVVNDIGVDAVKVGMLGSAETANAVAEVLERLSASNDLPGEGRGPASGLPRLGPGLRRGAPGLEERHVPIVFDPVMVATSGDVLADRETIAAFDRLMRIATVTTPNVEEFLVLARTTEADRLAIYRDAGSLARQTDRAILVTGTRDFGASVLIDQGDGRLQEESSDLYITDRLYQPDDRKGFDETAWYGKLIETTSSHGTGCTLASAIAVGLARGEPLEAAIALARRFVRASLEHAPGLGQGHGPMGQQYVTGFDA